MQSVSSRIWTRVAVSIYYDDNNYTTGTSSLGSVTPLSEMESEIFLTLSAMTKDFHYTLNIFSVTIYNH